MKATGIVIGTLGVVFLLGVFIQATCAAAQSAVMRKLPEHAELRYAVLYGDRDFKVGTTTYTWKVNGTRYSLNSVAEASGLAALMLSGRITQSSEGQILASGLQPEQFQIIRKNVRKEYALFDWPHRRVELLRGKIEALPPMTQDLLSFPFHLAMTAGEEGTWSLPVTGGKYLKDYRFHVLGRENLEIAGKVVETLHIQASRSNEGNADVWLQPSLHWLPVRIRNVDEGGKQIVQSLLDCRL